MTCVPDMALAPPYLDVFFLLLLNHLFHSLLFSQRVSDAPPLLLPGAPPSSFRGALPVLLPHLPELLRSPVLRTICTPGDLYLRRCPIAGLHISGVVAHIPAPTPNLRIPQRRAVQLCYEQRAELLLAVVDLAPSGGRRGCQRWAALQERAELLPTVASLAPSGGWRFSQQGTMMMLPSAGGLATSSRWCGCHKSTVFLSVVGGAGIGRWPC
jgi:hypothetical protein